MIGHDEMTRDAILHADAILACAGCTMGRPPIKVKHITRGRYYNRRHEIVLPAWLWQGGRGSVKEWNQPGYLWYYISHELAHAICGARGIRAKHGPEFQRLCHKLAGQHYHFEQDYKPKLYAAHMRRIETCITDGAVNAA